MSFFSAAFQAYLIGGIFILTGILHFIRPEFYVKIMPDYIPWHLTMVYLSGVAEIMGGIGFLLSDYRVYAAWGIILMLIVFFTVHIDMAWVAYNKHGLTLRTWLLIGRFCLQFVLIWWVYKVGVGS